MDKAIDRLKLVNKVYPDSTTEDEAKRKVFHHFYGATRFITRDTVGSIKITVDTEMVDILSGRTKF